jgi:PmbA protein
VTPEELEALAERALGHAAGEAQATVMRERSLLSRFARSRPTQATSIDDVDVDVLCLVDGIAGGACTNQLGDDALRETARRARDAAQVAARSVPADGERAPNLAEPAAYRAHDGYDPLTARLDAELAGRALQTVFDVVGVGGLEAFGVWTAGDVATVIATSRGVLAGDRVTDAGLKVTARGGDGRSGWGAAAGVSVSDLDAEAIAARSLAAAPRAEAIELAPGEYPVVLAPEAVGELLDFLATTAFNGLTHAEGRGALSGRLGTRVAAPAIQLADSPRLPRTLPRAFDADGVPKAPLALIEDGIANRVVHDRRSAAMALGGTVSTGHATRPGGAPSGPHATNLVLAGGGATGIGELCAPIERGLYVTRLWYVNVVDGRHSLLTGTTRDGTYLIEHGVITSPVKDVRFTDSVLRLLSATEDLTAWQRLVSDTNFYGRRYASGVVCPALRARGFRVTGQTV